LIGVTKRFVGGAFQSAKNRVSKEGEHICFVYLPRLTITNRIVGNNKMGCSAQSRRKHRTKVGDKVLLIIGDLKPNWFYAVIDKSFFGVFCFFEELLGAGAPAKAKNHWFYKQCVEMAKIDLRLQEVGL